jgi:hypothetical protein
MFKAMPSVRIKLSFINMYKAADTKRVMKLRLKELAGTLPGFPEAPRFFQYNILYLKLGQDPEHFLWSFPTEH